MGLLAYGLTFAAPLHAQQANNAANNSSAYTCTDASGRKLTSDRLIAACMDREQRQMLPNGSVRIIPPKATLQEKAAQENEARLAAERQREEARKRAEMRALLARYPDRAALDAARAEALKLPQSQVQSAQARIDELTKTRKSIDQELEFYAKNPEQIPHTLRRKIDSHESAINAQRLDIANYTAEATRINQRFDEEALRLIPLWR